MTYLDTIKEKRASEALAKEQIQKHQTSIGATLRSGKAVAEEVAKQAAKSRSEKQAVVFDKSDLAKSQDVFTLMECIKELGTILKPEGIDWKPVETALNGLSEQMAQLPKSYPEMPEPPEDVTVKNLSELEPTLNKITEAISKLDLKPVFDPKITVKPADVKVTEKTVDLTPVVKAVQSLVPVMESLKAATEKKDDAQLLSAVRSTTEAINSIRFPIPNYVLPFRQDGKATQVTLDSSGALPVAFSSSTYKLILDETTTTSVTYVGKAALGSATSAAVWQIQKIDETSGLAITWGGTGAFDQVWDNRATTVVYA